MKLFSARRSSNPPSKTVKLSSRTPTNLPVLRWILCTFLALNAAFGVAAINYKEILESITKEEGVVYHGDTLVFKVDVSGATNSSLPRSDDVRLRIFNPNGDYTLCDVNLFVHVANGEFECSFREDAAHFKLGENIFKLEVYSVKTSDVFIRQDLTPIHRFDHHIADGYYESFVPEFERNKKISEIVLASILTAGLHQGIQAGYIERAIHAHPTQVALKCIRKVSAIVTDIKEALPKPLSLEHLVWILARYLANSLLWQSRRVYESLATVAGSLLGRLNDLFLKYIRFTGNGIRRAFLAVGIDIGDDDPSGGGKRPPHHGRYTYTGSGSSAFPVARRPPAGTITGTIGVPVSSQKKATSFLGRSFQGAAALTALWAVSPAGPIGYSFVESIRVKAKATQANVALVRPAVGDTRGAIAKRLDSVLSPKCPFLRPFLKTGQKPCSSATTATNARKSTGSTGLQ